MLPDRILFRELAARFRLEHESADPDADAEGDAEADAAGVAEAVVARRRWRDWARKAGADRWLARAS
jgi:hypothetical protein